MAEYLRDMVGYGPTPPDPRWPHGAQIAVQFVLNYEEGAENCVLDGDAHAETFLSEIVPAEPFPDRHMSMESLYEYGSRAGVWRVLRAFERRGLPLTVFAVARALQRNPEATAAFVELGHELACHGLRWKSYQNIAEAVEREHMREAVELHTALTGARPLGWYTGRDSANTRRLVVEHGGFAYDSDSYADDLPYWVRMPVQANLADESPASGRCPQQGAPRRGVQEQRGTSAAHEERSNAADRRQGAWIDHLVVPYTLDTNDMRYSSPAGFPSGDQFFAHLRDAFDVLWREGGEGAPKMLSVGLHCRLAGRPARAAALERFLDHVLSHERVWVARRIEIAEHWRRVHPA